jgi:23S rRNA U2552 (ribose-2'-O)-methylase RlmE/FtsJ
MIEMYNLFDLGSSINTNCKSFHIAEGPGGFMEAMCDLRGLSNDMYVGITLIDENNYSIPGWKKSKRFLEKKPNVVIEVGATGNGDIMCASNLKHCYEKYGGYMDIVTADGGFDFSVDFNHQETVSAKLIFCQIAFAAAVQKKGGHFLIKFFDTFTQVSLDMLFLLSLLYEEVNVVKPNTSRYANSEKYVVCKKFRVCDSKKHSLIDCFLDIFETNTFKEDSSITSILNINIPYFYSCKLQEYNAIFGQQQIESISSTLSLININKQERLESMKKNNLQKCVLWCKKYSIPHNTIPVNSNMFLSKTNNILHSD